MMTSHQPDEIAEEKPRTIARRRQVLDAAAICFRRHGFHACSMAQIAAEAGMSVGHIYRYFPGKEAIIAGIVRAYVDDALESMAAFPIDAPNLKAALMERCAEGFAKALNPDEAALMIEIRAEAARNPAVRKMVNEGDAEISIKLRQIIATAIGRPIPTPDLEARVEMFHLIFQGLGWRTVINPEIDGPALSSLAILAIDAILSQ